jgi:hypothetical protein
MPDNIDCAIIELSQIILDVHADKEQVIPDDVQTVLQ